MRLIIFTICTTVLFTACQPKTKTTAENVVTGTANAPASMNNDESLKSVIVETETIMPNGMGKTIMRLTFDDHGKKRLTEMTTQISISGHDINNAVSTLMKDGYMYSWSNGSKQGTKMKLDSSRLDPKKFPDISNLSEEMKAKYNFKDEGTEDIEGRSCKVFSYSVAPMKGKVWMWKQVPLKSQVMVSGQTITTNFKSIQENPSIPSSKFEVPSGIQFTERSLPISTNH